MDNAKLTLSVIIPNYNYQDYVGEAIESALNVDWPDIQVIVVDDGSTDNSRAVIERFGTRIETIFKENTGQIVTCNLGFARARGNIVIFLDSDDRLDPRVMRELAAVWRPGVSKVQFQMQTMDASGALLAARFPQYHVFPTPEKMRRWAMKAAAFPTPPGSGNAYARAYLEQIYPLDDSCGSANDSCCLAAAPFLGDVITIAKPLVHYRVHGRNQGAISELKGDQVRRQVVRALQRFDYAQRIARSVGIDVLDQSKWRSLSLMSYRMASFRIEPDKHPIAGDGNGRILWAALRAAATPQGIGIRGVVTLMAWIGMLAVLPAGAARTLILWRFSHAARPRFLRAWLVRFGVVR